MNERILIVTKPHDDHAHLVTTGLEMMGVEPLIFRFGMMPLYETHTVRLDERAQFCVNQSVLVDETVPLKRVWLRRIGGSSLKFMDMDENDKPYVTNIMAAYRTSLFALLDRIMSERPDAMVNGYWAKTATDSKVLQLWQARKAGLTVPDTIQSNDPDVIRAFQKRHGGRIICKSLVPQMWKTDDRIAFAYTAIMPDIDTLPADALRLHPAIYQPYIEKTFEARVIIFGGKQFGIRIDSQADPRSVVDWRGKRLMKNNNVNYRIPDDIFAACRDLMRRLGIAYGAFDFIVTPQGEHIFLEVNEAGQFMFVEDCGPKDKIAHAFCHFLIHGSLDDWREEDATFSLKDLLSSDRFAQLKAADNHFRDYDRTSRVSRFDDAVGSFNDANIDLRVKGDAA